MDQFQLRKKEFKFVQINKKVWFEEKNLCLLLMFINVLGGTKGKPRTPWCFDRVCSLDIPTGSKTEGGSHDHITDSASQ